MTEHVHANGTLEIAQSNQDLLNDKAKRKKRTWFIVAVVCGGVLALVVVAIILLMYSKEEVREEKEQLILRQSLTLEDLLRGKFYPSPFNGTWISGNELIYMDYRGNLVLKNLDLDVNSTTILLSYTDELSQTPYDYQLSADRKYLLISRVVAKLYRYSRISRYFVINIRTGGRTQLDVKQNTDLQLAKWSPQGSTLALVYRNNIYYKKSPVDAETVQITNDTDFIYNGVPDWVYEEEVFNSNEAMWFSPDSKQLSFGRFDDRGVPLMVLPIYGEPGSLAFQYPKANVVRYPKSGAPNPLVSFHVVNLENPTEIKELKPPPDVARQQPILAAVSWATDTVVSAIWMNRVQNESSLVAYDVKNFSNIQILKNIKEEKGWIELFTPLLFSSNGSQFVTILSSDQENNSGGYRHILLFDRKNNSEAVPLTKGKFVVTKIVGWDDKENVIYYLANTEQDSAVQHLYKVSVLTKETSCLTCELKRTDSNQTCLFNSAEFSKDFSYYVANCEGPDVPESAIYTKNNTKLLTWEKNQDLFNLTRKRDIPKIKRMIFNITDEFKGQAVIKLPPNLDTSGATKYPMVINVYGGPDSSQVTERFSLDWGSYLSANKSIIYASIDGRGSGLQGDKMLFAIYKRLGSYEIADQIFITSQIQKALPYVDASRTAIWGWSYGGYASGMALATDYKGVFKCGMSVAPVTDWLLYDTIYTERFMGLPTVNDNLGGYLRSKLLSHAMGLKDKEYFLIHGTYDDNVHYQQSLQWAKVLEHDDILFRQLTYTDEPHDLGSIRPHLYHSLENFLDDCFIKNQ